MDCEKSGSVDCWCLLLQTYFFSSRRRHTRYWRDWSSDVCSSDLAAARARAQRLQTGWQRGGRVMRRHEHAHRGWRRCGRRSEERRVGKECRSRWTPDHSKKKIAIHIDNGLGTHMSSCSTPLDVYN